MNNMDMRAIDINGNGIADIVEQDMNGDGMIERLVIDVNCDGIADVTVQSNPGLVKVSENSNQGSFGHFEDAASALDVTANVIHFNGNEIVNVLGVDTTGDGMADTIGVDLNGNGTVDILGQTIDLNGDGIADIVGIDLDGDGTIDRFIDMNDL